MISLLPLVLCLCALMLVPCVLAAANLRVDLRLTIGTEPIEVAKAPAPPPAAVQGCTAATPDLKPTARHARYAEHSIALDAALRRMTLALARIAAGAEPHSALVARRTTQRIEIAHEPVQHLVAFARKRLELIAYGQEKTAAAIAQMALHS